MASADMLITFLKFALLAALAPIWWPIVKALHREVEAALLEEGGLLGRTPTDDEIVVLREKYKDYRDPLVSTPWAEARPEPRGRAGKNDGGESDAAAPRRGSGQPLKARTSSTAGPARRGF